MIAAASLHSQRRRRNHPILAREEGRTDSQEENPNETAQRRELLVRSRIESPETIKSRASPVQSNSGETRHDGTKEQELSIAVNPGVLGATAIRGWWDSLIRIC
jgi:hypothetical protein